MAPVYDTVNVASVDVSVYRRASLNVGALNASFHFPSLNQSVVGTTPEQMVGQAFDGISDNYSNGLQFNGSSNFVYFTFKEPIFLLSVSFDVNSTQVVSGTFEQQGFMQSYDLKKPYTQDVFTNDTVVFDYTKNGGIGLFLTTGGYIEFYTSVLHIGEIKISAKRAADIIPSDMLSLLRDNITHSSPEELSLEWLDNEWSNDGTSWKAASTINETISGKKYLPMEYDITPVPSSVNVTNLFYWRRVYSQEQFVERECVPYNVTQLEIIPRYDLQVTRVDIVWDRLMPEDVAKRPSVTFEGWDGSAWSPLLRTTLQLAKTHEVHQYVPVISEKLKVSVNYRNSSASLCFLRWEGALVPNDQYLIQTTSTTSAAQATSTAPATLIKSAATPTTTPKKSSGIKITQPIILFTCVLLLFLMV